MPEQQLVRDGRTEVEYDDMYNDLGMTIGDFARWMIMLDGHGPLSAASVQRMWTQTLLADGTPAREVYSFSGYGLGTGLDEVLGERVVLHTGHSGVAWVKFPALDLGVIVFTNLEHPQGSDPVGLALAVAGLLEPRLSLRALVPPKSAEPAAARELRHDYELFLAGTPDLRRYTAHMQPTMWAARDSFTSRLPRLGPLRVLGIPARRARRWRADAAVPRHARARRDLPALLARSRRTHQPAGVVAPLASPVPVHLARELTYALLRPARSYS